MSRSRALLYANEWTFIEAVKSGYALDTKDLVIPFDDRVIFWRQILWMIGNRVFKLTRDDCDEFGEVQN